MGLRIIYGKPGSGKSSFCFSEIAKLLKTEKKIYVITPEQFSFTAEQKLMASIDTKAVMNAEVITLSRMAYRVLNEVGGSTITNLSKCGKAMLIYSILNKHKKDLKFLGKTDENIDLSINAITEFKKHNINVEKLKEEDKKIKDPYLKTKLEDMILIYDEFQNKIENCYIEETDLLNILAKNIKNTDLIKESIIYIDEFAGFTEQEYIVIEELIKQAKHVNITICIDNLETDTNPDKDIFYSNKITLKKLLNLVKNSNLKLEKPVELKEIHRFKSPELKHLSENMYNIKSTVYNKNVDNIKLFLSKNEYSEIEYVAKKINKLVRENNLRYRDISIITKNIESYSSLVRAIFNKYEIPVFIDEKRDLNQNIIIQYILSILEVLNKGFSSESFFSYVKLGFNQIENDEIFELENYCNKWGIRYNKFKRDFVYEIDTKKQEIERLNEIRKILINPLVQLQEDIKNDKTAEGITKLLYEFIQKQEIEKKIIEKIEDLENNNLIDLANEYKMSYKIVMDVFDEIVTIFRDDKMTIDQYSKILKIGLKNSGLGKIPGTQDQVIFGDIDRSRSHKVEAVFIIGLNDGIFPTINKDEGFFNDKDREQLKEYDIELAKGTTENLYEDNFNIYKAFTTAEKLLYLSYISSNGEGKTQRPSILLNKIKKIFPDLKEQSDVINKNYEIINSEITYEELIENIDRLRKEQNIDEIWYQVYNYYKDNPQWSNRLKEDLKGLNYTNQAKNISQNNIKKLYGNVLNTSISRLEKYRKCPFSYHLEYGLKLKEREQLKVQSINTGSLMHEVIAQFFDQVGGNKAELSKLDEDEIKEIVSQIIDEEITLNKNVIFTATAKYKVLLNRLKRIIVKSLKYIIKTILNSEFNIEGCEVKFGEGGKYKPISIQLDDDKKIEVTGVIDRIDSVVVDGKKYVRIIDYKSSPKVLEMSDVKAGIQIQLLTYIDAICLQQKVIPTAILYFPLIEEVLNVSKKHSTEELEKKIGSRLRMTGLLISDVRIIKMNDNKLVTGSSDIINARLSKNGNVDKRKTDDIDYKNFRLLQRYVYRTIKQIGQEIYNGRIDINPYNKIKGNACEYCKYKSICDFNPKYQNNKYRYILPVSKDDVYTELENQEKGL